MLSKNTIKLIKSLGIKKYRNKENLFVVEGDKMVLEVIKSDLKITELIVTPQFYYQDKIHHKNIAKITEVEHRELKQCSFLKTPQNSLAVCEKPIKNDLPTTLTDGLSLFLDGIQDPGNLGTIIRICDWFGIEQIFCSTDTVDLYNPKVIQASMGSFNRVNMWDCSFEEIQTIALKSGTAIYGAFMDGTNIYKEELPDNALLVVGNEGNGIRKDVEALIEKRISIPNLSAHKAKAESLNVSVATAIICSEFKRLK